jgi:hypothetical protein
MESGEQTEDEPDFATREEQAAAAEAGAIGGGVPDGGGIDTDEVVDEALRAVYEAGGGEQEGFELAERDLIRNASHDDGKGLPSLDRFDAEVESDRSSVDYGEADDIEPTDL